MSNFIELDHEDNIDIPLMLGEDNVEIDLNELEAVVVPDDKKPQTKVIVPTKERQEVTADVGFKLDKTIVEPIPDKYNDTSDATATVYDIANGKTAYTKEGLVEGLLVDRLQWKCDNMQSLANEFNGCKVSVVDILQGLDVSNVKSFNYMFQNYSPNEDLVFDYKKATATVQSMFASSKFLSITLLNAENLNFGTVSNPMFYMCSSLKTIKGLICTNVINAEALFDYCTALESINDNDGVDLSNATKTTNCFRNCSKLVNLRVTTTNKLNDTTNMFYSCPTLKTIDGVIEMLNVTSNNNMFYSCKALESVVLKNIKTSLQLGVASGQYGLYLTDETVINTAKELWDMTGSSSKTLTLSSRPKTKLDTIYVKLVTPTAEQIANDPYINNKKPCEVCESTDAGAMTLREYIVSKNWAIA